MEALRIIKRIASYGVFAAAATLFLVNSITVSLAPYIDMIHAYENSFMPFLYATLSFGVLLLFQLLVIGKPKEIEETIYPWLLIVLFGVSLFVSSFVLGRSVVACLEDQTKNVGYALAGLLPVLMLSLTEVVVGAFLLFKNQKLPAKPSQIDENGVNLTKEE